jgi:protein phosphatase methylesterase 1
MGGAIASKLVTFVSKSADDAELYKKIKSLFVIDVVEGTALEALPMMEHIVKSRP